MIYLGVIVSAYSSAFLIVRLFMPALVRKTSEETLLTACLFVSSLTYVLLSLSEHIFLLIALSLTLGLGLGCGQPLTTILTYNRAPAGRTGEALGVRFMVNRITTFSIPLVFGSLGSAFGLIPVFWTNSVLLAVGAFFSKVKRKEGSTQ